MSTNESGIGTNEAPARFVIPGPRCTDNPRVDICVTVEEAYSLGLQLLTHAERHGKPRLIWTPKDIEEMDAINAGVIKVYNEMIELCTEKIAESKKSVAEARDLVAQANLDLDAQIKDVDTLLDCIEGLLKDTQISASEGTSDRVLARKCAQAMDMLVKHGRRPAQPQQISAGVWQDPPRKDELPAYGLERKNLPARFYEARLSQAGWSFWTVASWNREPAISYGSGDYMGIWDSEHNVLLYPRLQDVFRALRHHDLSAASILPEQPPIEQMNLSIPQGSPYRFREVYLTAKGKSVWQNYGIKSWPSDAAHDPSLDMDRTYKGVWDTEAKVLLPPRPKVDPARAGGDRTAVTTWSQDAHGRFYPEHTRHLDENGMVQAHAATPPSRDLTVTRAAVARALGYLRRGQTRNAQYVLEQLR